MDIILLNCAFSREGAQDGSIFLWDLETGTKVLMMDRNCGGHSAGESPPAVCLVISHHILRGDFSFLILFSVCVAAVTGIQFTDDDNHIVSCDITGT